MDDFKPYPGPPRPEDFRETHPPRQSALPVSRSPEPRRGMVVVFLGRKYKVVKVGLNGKIVLKKLK